MRGSDDLDLLFATLRYATGICDAAGISHAVAGGLSLSFWARPRATFDVDLVLALPQDQAEQIAKQLGDSGQFPFAPIVIQFGDRSLIRVHRISTRPEDKEIIVIDLLLYDAPFAAAIAANRRRQVIHDAGEFWFCSAEDLIIMKLIADRDQDQSDILAILRRRGLSLNLDYINQWANHFSKQDAWAARLDQWKAN